MHSNPRTAGNKATKATDGQEKKPISEGRLGRAKCK